MVPANMRSRIPESRKHRARGVSLPPELERFAIKRAFDANLSFSRYVQTLARLDQAENVLPRALTLNLGKEGA
jgi:hypothetical protein